jgi:hypothetical protein
MHVLNILRNSRARELSIEARIPTPLIYKLATGEQNRITSTTDVGTADSTRIATANTTAKIKLSPRGG